MPRLHHDDLGVPLPCDHGFGRARIADGLHAVLTSRGLRGLRPRRADQDVRAVTRFAELQPVPPHREVRVRLLDGSGVRGDIKAVVKAILLDPEARGDAKSDPNFGKLREPFQFATNILLNFNVRSADTLGLSDGYLLGRGEYTGMAQIPFQSPTVFNYFPPGYVIPGTGLLGPEFALMTTGTSIQRANFVNRMVFTSPAVPISAPTNQGGAPNGTSLDFSDLQALATADTSGNSLVDELNRRLMHGTMSGSMKSTILTAVTNITSADPLNRARQAVYLVATSSQYQVQR